MRDELRNLIFEIGGEDRLFEILRTFYLKMSQDILIGYFFDGRNLEHVSKMQGLFMLRAAGLSMDYPGKPPHQAHLELPPILEGHFDRRLTLLKEHLVELKLDPKLVEFWVAFEDGFRAQVVDSKPNHEIK